MAKTNWQDPKTSEMRSTHISGLMEAVGKIEDSIGMETVTETNIPLTEVFISSDDRYRIFQAPEGKRNWTADYPPVIKKNGVVITSGFEIDYGGGAIILNVNDTVENTYTADVKYTKTTEIDVSADINAHNTSGTAHDDIRESINDLDAEVVAHKAEKATQNGYGHIRLSDIPESGGKRTARFTVGTSTAGWTAADCDYLCDGTADQTEINTAITALPATGGEVVILDGTYNITAKIDVNKNNVSIRGNGNATILRRMFNSASTEGVITLTGRSGCKIANLQVDGNKTSYTNGNNFGIYTYSSSDNTITGNTCNNNNYGIYLSSNSNENTITGNTCNNNNFGIYLSTSSNNTITGNTCNNNNSYGINLSSSNNNTVTGNTYNNNDEGIYLFSSNNNTVTGNTCNDNNRGIYLRGSNNTVTGNTYNNNDEGIYLNKSNNNTVTGNTCIRGTGLATDYTESQHTIRVRGTDNGYNLIAMNNCMGKAVTNEGGTGNTLVNNKFDAT